MAIRRAFVTGGSGFVGKQLIADLRAHGVHVRALVRSSASAKTVSDAGGEAVQGDLQDVKAMEEGMRTGGGCDVVFHCASALGVNIDDHKALHRDNVRGTSNVLTAAIAAGVRRIVYVSSLVVVFDGRPLVDAAEDTPIPRRHVSYYAFTKAEAERLVLAATEIEAVVVRLPLVWGGGDSILIGLVRMARRGLWVWPAGGRYPVSTLHVMNASAGIIKAAERGVDGEVYHLCDDKKPTFKQVFHARLKSAGCRPWQIGDAVFSRNFPVWIFWILVWLCEFLWRVLPLPGAPPIPREGIAIAATEMTADDSKARRVLRYTPVIGWDAGLLQEAAWFRSLPSNK